MDAILNWLLRGIFFAAGAGAALLIYRALRESQRSRRERWPLRIAFVAVALCLVYGAGHAWMLVNAEKLEAGRAEYLRFGDPRRTEQQRAEVRGWILDCGSRPEDALARYAERNGVVERVYPLGNAGANLVGGGEDADLRDYTIERLFAEHLRRPISLSEQGALHPAGTDLHLTLCSGATARAWELLQQSGHPGTVLVQDVQTGALVAYVSTGGPDDPPLGLREYAAPGSIWKLAIAALWWEHDIPERPMDCPSEIRLSPRASIRNAGGFSIPQVSAPTEMLVHSCNTTAVEMALELRESLGEEAFAEAFRRFGVEPYSGEEAASAADLEFWNTGSQAWRRRLSPPTARVRLSAETSREEWGQLAIGQGPIDVTAVHMARFLSAIGNGGVMMRPTLEQDRAAAPEEVGRIMSPETSARLLAAMREVVDRGTARSTAPILAGLDWQLAGKTGTAEVARAPDNGWFAGLIVDPSGRPRYSVVTFLVGGGPGGRRPAAIAAGMTRYLATEAESEETP